MAKDDEKKPTATDKGKGKAVNGEAEKEVKKDKDGKPIEDEKKGVMPAGTFLELRRRGCCNRTSGIMGANMSCRRTQRGGSAAQERARHAG